MSNQEHPNLTDLSPAVTPTNGEAQTTAQNSITKKKPRPNFFINIKNAVTSPLEFFWKKPPKIKVARPKYIVAKVISLLAFAYVSYSLIMPIAKLGEPPRKIEIPDIIIITIVIFFYSDLANKVEWRISQDGSLSVRINNLSTEIAQQQKSIDNFQTEQLNKLTQSQKFMYDFLLGEQYNNILKKLKEDHEAKDREDRVKFKVPHYVGDELRHLRNLKLIERTPSFKTGWVSDVVKASEGGKKEIDLTDYFQLTKKGKDYLEFRQQLQSKNQEEPTSSQETSKVE